MKKATGALIVGIVALACAIAGVAAAPGSSSRHAAHPRVGKVVAKVPIPAGPGGFAVGERAVWAVSDSGPTLTRIDPDRNAAAASVKIKLRNACPAAPPGCGEAAAGDGAVWVTHTTDNTVSRIDPGTNAVAATINVGPQPRGVASLARRSLGRQERWAHRLAHRPVDEPRRRNDSCRPGSRCFRVDERDCRGRCRVGQRSEPERRRPDRSGDERGRLDDPCRRPDMRLSGSRPKRDLGQRETTATTTSLDSTHIRIGEPAK